MRYKHLVHTMTLSFSMFYSAISLANLEVNILSTNSTACGWFDTGMDVSSGTILNISASGLWTLGIGDRTGDANGLSQHGLFNDFLYGTLVGRIGVEGDIFSIGTHYSETLAASGRLFLANNDSNCEDNSGSIQVQITTTCPVYAIHDEGFNDSQFFTLNPINGDLNKLGPLHKDHDIESLDIHPRTNELYAASGDDTRQKGYLYKVDKSNGSLTTVGDIVDQSTGLSYKEVDGLSFRPSRETLWAWAQGEGLLKIDANLATAKLIRPYDGEIEDITWSADGRLLYAVENLHDANTDPDAEQDPGQGGVKLWVYEANSGMVGLVCNRTFPNAREVEALEMLPGANNLMMIGSHSHDKLRIYTVDLDTCDVQIEERTGVRPYYDVEGIAWPNSCQVLD